MVKRMGVTKRAKDQDHGVISYLLTKPLKVKKHAEIRGHIETDVFQTASMHAVCETVTNRPTSMVKDKIAGKSDSLRLSELQDRGYIHFSGTTL